MLLWDFKFPEMRIVLLTLTTSMCPAATAKCMGHQLVFRALLTPPGPAFLLTISTAASRSERYISKVLSLKETPEI